MLDRETHRYQKFISDIAGQDTESHDNDVGKLIAKVRSFLSNAAGGAPLPSGATVTADYDAFTAALPALCEPLEFDPGDLEFREFAWIAADYVAARSSA